MSETAKTLTFVAVAAAAVLLAVVSRPSLHVAGPEDMRDQPLYPDFTEPLSVASLEIVEFDDQRGVVHPFKVAKVEVKGMERWSIPSHEDYPADAKNQVAEAAAGLMGLKVLEMVSDNQGDQRTYGVIEPDPKTLKVGETGVGRKVIMRDKDGKELLALVIGKEVPDRPGLRYVRKVGQSPILIVQAKTDRLSTKFENWIERNLLNINSFDIKRLWIRDHSVDALNRALIQRGETIIEYDDAATPKWKLVEDRKFVPAAGGGTWEPVKMPEDEELNTTKLDELKNAMDDLKIVDVSRKPAGLSADLKAAADFAAKDEAFLSLREKGFFAAQLAQDGPIELFSNEGEIRLIMKDGVVYVLRFGGIAGAGASKSEDTEKENDKDKEKESDSAGLNRYLFVMAEFDQDVLPKPQLEPLPEVKDQPDQNTEDANKSEEKKPEESVKAEASKPDEAKPAETDAPKANDAKPEDAKPEQNAEKKDANAERERIEKENKRKQEEYDQKIADGKKRVTELNNRFADWYYVISEDVYRKIHLSHSDLFKKKEAEKKSDEKQDEQAGHAHEANDLEKLKSEGLKTDK